MKLTIRYVREKGREKAIYLVDGKEVTKRAFEKLLPPAGADRELCAHRCGGDWSKPVLSDALAVHPEQIEEATKDAIRMGVPMEFAEDGRAIVRSNQQKQAYLKAYGMFDRSAGYTGAQFNGTTQLLPPKWREGV